MGYVEKKKNLSDTARLENAANGIQHAIEKESSIRKQILALVGICLLLYVIFHDRHLVKQTTVWWWVVIGVEMLNSCIERLCDIVQPEYDDRIWKIKDMAAWATLFVGILAWIVLLIDILFILL